MFLSVLFKKSFYKKAGMSRDLWLIAGIDMQSTAWKFLFLPVR
jgi:hypothetical protein